MGVVEDALKGFGKDVNKVFGGVLGDAGNFFKNVPKDMNKGIDNMDKNMKKFPKKVMKPISKFMKDNVEKPIMDMVSGIDDMILDFVRIVCFINKSPVRFRNLGASFDNVFNGVIEEFIAIGYAFELGFNSVSSLVFYVSVFIESYLNCAVKLSSNLLSCIPFYIFDIIGQMLYLPIRLILWAFSTFLAINLYAIEKQVWNGLKTMNDQLYPYIGFHLIHYPKHIRENCYTCIRLKDDVVNRKSKEVKHTFEKEIPEMLGKSKDKFMKGQKQFEEVFAFPDVKEPQDV